MNTDKIQRSHQERMAVIYVRQSSMHQVHHNLESQGRSMSWRSWHANWVLPR